jgi:anti-anti-sigma regulatory factor
MPWRAFSTGDLRVELFMNNDRCLIVAVGEVNADTWNGLREAVQNALGLSRLTSVDLNLRLASFPDEAYFGELVSRLVQASVTGPTVEISGPLSVGES